MADFISGVENDLSKGYQSVKHFGSNLLDDSESVASGTLHAIERAGHATYDTLKKSASYVGESAESMYHHVMGDSQPETIHPVHHTSNLNKMQTAHLPIPNNVVVHPKMHLPSKKTMFKTLVNWTILLLVLLLIGVIIYLTCKRYSLIGDAISSGNNMLAAALLSPELSTGLSTLAAAL